MKKTLSLIACLCQATSIYAMERNTNNFIPHTTTQTIEENSIQRQRQLFQNLRKIRLILDAPNNNTNNNNADFNDLESDKEGDFLTLTDHPKKQSKEIKNNDAFSRLIRREYRKLKKTKRIIYKKSSNNPFFSSNHSVFSPDDQDDFDDSMTQNTFFKPFQLDDKRMEVEDNQSSEEEFSDCDSDGETDDYDFPELKEIEYKLRLLEFCADDIALESKLPQGPDDREEDISQRQTDMMRPLHTGTSENILETLNNLSDNDLLRIMNDLKRFYGRPSSDQG